MNCPVCDENGIVFCDGVAHACSCPAGEVNRRPMYRPHDKEKKFAYYMPVHGVVPRPGLLPEAPPPSGRALAAKDG